MSNQENYDRSAPAAPFSNNEKASQSTIYMSANTDQQSSPQTPMGGPQFGNENNSNRGKDGKFRDWLSKYGSSVILPIIALLILAGGIYLYATQKEQTVVPPEEKNGQIEDQLTDNETDEPEKNQADNKEDDDNKNDQGQPQQDADQSQDEQQQKSEDKQQKDVKEIIPEPKIEEGKIIETAVKGDGVTHLARKALANYLEDHQQEQELTNEHKIYIEDLLQNQKGSQPLEVGEEVSFDQKEIQGAIDASLELTENQLKNLEKYSAQVDWE